jgi:hypothetical protein
VMAVDPIPWWKRKLNVPVGVTFIYYLFFMVALFSILEHSFPYWYLAAVGSIVAAFAFVNGWRYTHPDEDRRRRIEAGYPPDAWWNR